ncbi:MAG: pyridoxamine 5'-phosphate oxidase family protein [Methanobacterium sp.]
MDMVKIPFMSKEEYDKLIKENHVSRIAFSGEDYPYIAPFMYIFNKEKFLYFLSTKYGKKMDLFKKNPNVAVEIEKYSADMSSYKFVTLQGKIIEVNDEVENKEIKEKFIDMIQNKLSNKALAALGYSPDESPGSLINEERALLWKLVDVKKIVALKNPL